MRTKRHLPALLFVAAAAMAACTSNGAEDTSTIEDATGGTTAVPTPGLPVTYTGPNGVPTTVEDVTRIVTLSGDMTEIIFELGLGPNVVGADLSSVYPAEAGELYKVGVEFRLVAEFILDVEPTVVIGDADATPTEAIDQLRSAGIPVVIFPRFEGVDAPASKIRELAHVLGIDEAGEALAARVQDEIDAALGLVADAEYRPRVAVVYLASSENFLMLGENTVMTGVLEAVGAEDVSPVAGEEAYVIMTPEVLAAGDPEIIITAERGLGTYVDGLEGFLALPGVAQTTAAREGRVLVFEDLYLLGFGPRTGQLLVEIIEGIHPELASAS